MGQRLEGLSQNQGTPGAPRSSTRREGPSRGVPRRECGPVLPGSQPLASTRGGKRFPLSPPCLWSSVLAASGHPHGCVRVGGGRPSWAAEVLIPAALRTKSRSTLERGRTIPAPGIRGGADRCLWGARGGVSPSTCYAFPSFFQPLQGHRNKPTGPHGPGAGYALGFCGGALGVQGA